MNKLSTTVVSAAAIALFLTGCSTASNNADSPKPSPTTTASAAAEWSYAGENRPSHWDEANKTCTITTTSIQSPIDIEQSSLVPSDHATAPVFNYTAAEFEVENNGHTIEAVPNDLKANSLTLDGEVFYLQQFHLHNPSEHEINGSSAAMELHLVNKSDSGKIAVIGVLLNPGKANTTLSELFDNMPKKETTEETMVKLENTINPADLLPADSHIAQYTGSLTTPPCTEGVLWNVFETPGQVSQAQLDAFAAIYADNHRPVEPLNNRAVTDSPAN